MCAFLTWQTDPLLLDPKPQKQNVWVTANDLLTTNPFKNESSENLASLDGNWFSFYTNSNPLLPLYSIMVRRIDFVSGQRLLQSFPYILLEREWVEKLQKNNLSLAEKTHYYFQNTKADYTIKSWQKRIISYLENQQRLPFPLFRLAEGWEDFFINKQFIGFQSARGEDFQLPLYFTDELAYLVGVIMGDGHLAEYFVNIIDSSQEHIANLARKLALHFSSTIEVFEQQNAQAWNVNLLGKWIVRFFNFLSGQPINERKYPYLCEPLVFQSNNLYRRAFWRGLMDADGSYKSTISLGSASQQLIRDFEFFLHQNNIGFMNYTQEVFGGITYSVSILGNSRKDFVELLGSLHPKKQEEIAILLTRRINRHSLRPNTLLSHGSWKGQVVAFQQNKLINNYFDFTLLPHFGCIGFGTLLQDLRANHTQKDFAQKFSISQSLLSRYERNDAAISIALFSKILSKQNQSIHHLFTLFQNLVFQSTNSTCLLDTQASLPLLRLLQGLQLKDDTYFLFIGTPQQTLEEYKEDFCAYFFLNQPPERKLYNAVLLSFVKEFCILK